MSLASENRVPQQSSVPEFSMPANIASQLNKAWNIIMAVTSLTEVAVDSVDQTIVATVAEEEEELLKANLYVNYVEKSDHIVQKRYHGFDISFTGVNSSHQNLKNTSNNSDFTGNAPSNGMIAMVATQPEFMDDNCNKDNCNNHSPYNVWHHILGHPTFKVVSQVLTSCNIPFSFTKLSKTVRNACQLGKACKLRFPNSSTVYSNPLELVISDLWGPSPTTSYNGFRYYVTFVVALTRYTWIYFLKNKFDLYSSFLYFKNQAELQLQTKLLKFQPDWGGEFRSLASFFDHNGIVLDNLSPYL